MERGVAGLDADVLVAGGGLAGSLTALALVRRGLHCIVVDKAAFPRDKPCGEGLLPHGLELLAGLGLGDVVERCGGQPFRGILYRVLGRSHALRSGRAPVGGAVTARGDFEGGLSGRGVRRRELDDELRRRVAAAGATFVRGAVQGAALDERAATLALADGSHLRGRFLVGADGPRSTLRHALSLDAGPPRRPRYALRQHFRLPAGASLPDRVEVNVVDGYELYVTPVAAGTVGVAALCERRVMNEGAGRPEDRLKRLIEGCAPVADRLAGAAAESAALACGPLRVCARDVGRGRAFLVGDAAGYVDAITGEGMSLAIRTAASCADAVAAALHGAPLAEALAGYRRQRARVFRDHAILTFGLIELARHPFLARRAIARLAREPELFSRLLSVNNGTRSLASLGAVDFLKLAVGSAPA
jgi:menaquinone-9 beta-reductase